MLPLLVSENDYIFKPSASRYAMLAMVDVLATELAMANKPQAKDRLRRIAGARRPPRRRRPTAARRLIAASGDKALRLLAGTRQRLPGAVEIAA